jgi:cutinase
MKTAFGNKTVAIQGVNYAADIAGATSGATDPKDAAGAKNMAMLAMMATVTCPNTKIVLSGYSQGAEQVRGALMNMPSNKIAVSVSNSQLLGTLKILGDSTNALNASRLP